MRTLVVSDLHLGSRARRDVLRRPAALRRLVAACEEVDRLVLLGDTVELWEGRSQLAIDAAVPILRHLGEALGASTEAIVVAGNHDGALIRPWLRERGAELTLDDHVPVDASPGMAAICAALAPARVSVRYPGLWLADGVYATHGHYLDRLLVIPSQVERLLPEAVRQPLRAVPNEGATPWDFERAGGVGYAALQTALEATLPPGLGDAVDAAAGATRGLLIATLPVVQHLPAAQLLAPLSAGVLGYQFRRNGLRAMAETALRLAIGAEHLLFGHVHRSGALPGDDPAEWRPLVEGPLLHNSGSWVHEPLLLAGARPGHPYWPGGAIVVEDDGEPEVVNLLDDLHARELSP